MKYSKFAIASGIELIYTEREIQCENDHTKLVKEIMDLHRQGFVLIGSPYAIRNVAYQLMGLPL